MRDYKFRAWDKLSKIMYYHGNLENGDVMVLSIEGEIQFSSGDAYQQKDFELMQYTGLKDKNGKEIYEGDILESSHKLMRFEVYWSEDWAMFTVKGDSVEALMRWATYGEVIGNIHESPEHLQQPTG